MVKRVEKFCAKINEELTGGDRNYGSVLSMSGGSNVKIKFGTRYLYTDQPGARYVLKTKEEAESYIIKLQQAFPELEWTVYQPPGGRPTCEPYERITPAGPGGGLEGCVDPELG